MTTIPSNTINESANVVVDVQSTPPTLSKRVQRLDKAMAFFKSPIFIIPAIIACVYSALELHYGIYYANQCPIQPNINLFLIVHGSTKLGWVLVCIYAYIDAKVIYEIMNKKVLGRRLILPNLILQLLFTLWFFAWFITGQVWVFGCKSTVQSTDVSNTSTYCQSTLYSAAFGLIISTYIIMGIMILIMFRRAICRKIKNNTQASNHNGVENTNPKF